MKPSYVQLLCGQLKKVAPVEHADLSGKTVLVVGANVGIGFEAAEHFATMNPARLILACRSKEKGEAAIHTIETKTGYTKAELRLVDLSSFASVNAFGEACETDALHIDIFVYNAAVGMFRYETTGDGWETTLQVNNLSNMLLSILLLPSLLRAAEAGGQPRLVVVASDVHYFCKFSAADLKWPNILEKFNDKEYCSLSVMLDRYSLSKLFNVLFVREMALRLERAKLPVIAVSTNPGYCVSSLRRNLPAPVRVFDKFTEVIFARTAEEGARQLVWAAIGGRGREDELKGGFVMDADIVEPSDFVISDAGREAQRRVWEESVEVLSKVSPDFVKIVNERFITSA